LPTGLLERCELTEGPSAADWKLLHRKRQARTGTSNRKAVL